LRLCDARSVDATSFEPRFLRKLCASAVNSAVTIFDEPDVALTQDGAADPELAAAEAEVCHGCLTTNIVGCRYYAGQAHAGEYAALVREPHNPYDANAVRVDNMAGQQVGHVNRQAAAALARVMDTLGVRVEAVIPHDARNVFTLPTELAFYGRPESAAAVAELLRRHSLPLRHGSGAGTPAKAERSVVQSRVAHSGPRSQAELDALLEQLDASAVPLARFNAEEEAPALRSTLFEHQLVGVAWMLARERDPDSRSASGLPQFWSRAQEGGRTVFVNTITHSAQPAPPVSVRGGALFDEMGVGKSVQVLAVILAHPAPGLAPPAPASSAAAGGAEEEDLESKSLKTLQALAVRLNLPKSGTKAQLCAKVRASRTAAAAGPSQASSAGGVAPGARGTLIVCPVSVVSAWEDQVAQHLHPGGLALHSYVGATRNTDSLFLAAQDIVLVSYNTLAAEWAEGGNKRKRPSGLFAVPWRRVVLDEAHVVRNRATRACAAVQALECTFRWVLTGTPLTNKADDVHPLLAFLRCAPLDDFAVFNRAVGRPIREANDAGLARLRLLLRTVSLRRTKAAIQCRLPPKTVEIHSVRLEPHAREVYDALHASARAAVREALRSGGDDALLTCYRSVLECILRLRQCTDAHALVPARRVEAARAVLRRFRQHEVSPQSARSMAEEELAQLFAALSGALSGAAEAQEDAGADDCCVCLEALTEESARVLRACRHALCGPCLTRIASSGGAPRCPLCRSSFTLTDALSRSALAAAVAVAEARPDEAAAAPEAAAVEMPTKISALLEGLASMRAEGSDRKAVVFSQFTSFLDILQPCLSAASWPCARLDGSLSGAKRKDVLASWRAPNGSGAPAVLLVSTRAGGTGLNLTEANWVFLMDLWWNAATDDQAIDRVHRLGQRRAVHVVRYVAEASIEQNILDLQAKKAALGKGALGKLTAEETRAARAADLRSLFDA
jgi:SWI/SNF-related matrix-associated actin-dependent regulator of chromatin subfamily A3